MNAAEDLTPPTSRSGSAGSVRAPTPPVVIDSATAPDALRAITPSTSRHASVRVDRRLRNTKAHMMPKNERLVLRTLAGHADGADRCYPSVPTVADECGMSEATARAALRTLIDKHWLFISDDKRIDADGAQTSNEYTLTPERGEWWPEEDRKKLARPTPRERRSQAAPPVSSGETPPVSNDETGSVGDTAPVVNGDTGPVSSGDTAPPQMVIPPRSQAVTHEAPMEAPNEEPSEAPIAPAGARETSSFVLVPSGAKKRKAPVPPAEHPLPADFQPSDNHRERAKLEGVELARVFTEMRLWAAEGNLSQNWSLRLHTFLRNAGDRRRKLGEPEFVPPPPPRPPVIVEPRRPPPRMTEEERRQRVLAALNDGSLPMFRPTPDPQENHE